MKNYIFTSESVRAGHPDKICDQISDSVVDAYLALDPLARVGCETFATTNKIVVGGEVSTTNGKQLSNEDVDKLVRAVIKGLGYEQDGFHWQKLDVVNLIHTRSADLQASVIDGAGDQGLMFGYASDETDAYMPAPIHYCHRLMENIDKARPAGVRADGKCQITLQYENDKPVATKKLLISLQHDEHLNNEKLWHICQPFIKQTLPAHLQPADADFLANITDRFVIGGPDGDAGLTGRKIIVDTYGGSAPHGGGAFSGKDCTKVDRSGAYIARYMAKNVVANGLAKKCLIQVAYMIAMPEAASFYIDCFGTAKGSEEKLGKRLQELVDLRPRAIIERFGLNRPIFKRTATYGHFGRPPTPDGGFGWEKVDLKI